MLALACILALSAWLQWTTVRGTHVVDPARPDAASYASYAYNLREFGIYSRARTWQQTVPSAPAPDAVSGPGYPLFLAPFLSGKPNFLFMYRVEQAQAAIGVLTTLFTFLLARLALRPLTACIPTLLVALTPQLITNSTYVLTETLFTCFLVLSVLAFGWAIRGRSLWRWALAGCVFGICCLVRPALQALLPAVLIAVLLNRQWRPWLLRVSLATACWAMCLMPWFLYQRSIPASADNPSLLRATIYHGSFPDFVFEGHRENQGFPYRDDPHATDIMASNAGLVKWVSARMRADPLQYLEWYAIGKPRYFLSWYPIGAADDIFIYPVDASPFLNRPLFQAIRATMFGLHWPLMWFGLLGAALAWARPAVLGSTNAAVASTRLVALVVLAALALNAIGAPFPRYSVPFRPLIFILAIMAASVFARMVASVLRTERLKRKQRGHDAGARANPG